MAYHRNRKPLLLITLLALLLLGGACAAELLDSETINTDEAVMESQTEHDVQMLMDAFPEGDYHDAFVTHSVHTLRSNGVKTFVSVERVSDEEISDIEKRILIAIKLDIVDDTGTRYRVGFTEHGLAIKLYFPPDYISMVSLPPPPIE